MSGTEPPRHGADAAGPRRLVPVYAVTGGRTRPAGRELPMESLVTVTERAGWGHDLENEYRMIVELARRPVSLVEIGAALAVPVTVARVLVSDLVDGGFLDVHAPAPAFAGGRPSAAVLTRLLEGLRAR
jgi:Protein of unknown function (DUF742)